MGSFKPVVILDANVLYPAPIMDYLLHLASMHLYHPKWTYEIQDEWIRNLLLKRTELKRSDLEKTRRAMDRAFPDANVTKYESLISELSLPDTVLAAAIKGKADSIVTFNTKDFPAKNLRLYKMDSFSPDEFVSNLIILNKQESVNALKNQVNSLKNPPQSINEVLKTLKSAG